MTALTNILSRIDEITIEIEVLRVRYNKLDFGCSDIRKEVNRLTIEREQLREFCDKLKISEGCEKEQTVIGLILDVSMKICELEHLRRENEKLAADSVALGKIIKIIEDWGWDPAFIHLTMDEISAVIDERGD